MNLDQIKKDREKFLEWKNIKPLRQMIEHLPKILDIDIEFDDVIKINGNISCSQKDEILKTLKALKPWRKGPFDIFGIFVDSEWQSFLKYNLLNYHVNLKDKVVGDIGCNNGYYLFRMLKHKPKELIGFDPSPLYKCQFDFLDFYIQSGIKYELLGVEHLPIYEKKFDILFCLGVLYHRYNPIQTMKNLQKSLTKNGELILDTFYISGDSEMVLTPRKSYSKIPNVHFIPTIKALQNWSEKANFSHFEVLDKKKTDIFEQRKTDWIDTESLEDFLDPNNDDLTVEGYEAPKRVYVKMIK